MYFVTSKRPGYVLFCMTPSGRGGIGLGEDQHVELLKRESDGSWTTLREWPAGSLSHTDLMLALGEQEEPDDARELLRLVPNG